MTQALLIEDDPVLAEIYTLNLHMYVGADVICKSALVGALLTLKSRQEIQIIISRAQIGDEKTALALYQHLEKSNRMIPMLVIGEEKELQGKVVFISENDGVKVLLQSAAKVLQVTAQSMAQKVVADYYPIPASYLLHLSQGPCDIYVNISEGAEGPRYQKKYLAQATLVREEIETLLSQGITQFYVPQEMRLKFTNQVTDQLVKKIEQEILPEDERIEATAVASELVQEEIQSFGMSEKVVSTAKACINSMMKTVKGSKKLTALLDALLKNKGSYHFRHSQLTMFVAFHAIEHMDWGSTEQQEKLAFVSFFHDIVLANDEWTKIDSKDALLKARLSGKDLKRVDEHALLASQLIEKFPKAPIGASQIIMQHHGAIRGVGFPTIYSPALSPLTMVFLVCETFASKLLTYHEEGKVPDKKELLNEIYNKFRREKFKKIILTLAKLNF